MTSQDIKPFGELLGINPRPALNPIARRRLMKQFAKEVPEFSEYFTRKLNLQNFTILSALSVGIVSGARVAARGQNYIAATVAGAAYLGLTILALRSPIGKNLFGLDKFWEAECERAFNLWVYYEHNPNRLAAFPKQKAQELYDKKLNEFRASYNRSTYEKL